MALGFSTPLEVEIAYDWVLILIESIIIALHIIRVRIQYAKLPVKSKKAMFREFDSRSFSFGVLFFALVVIFNRFFAIAGLYGVSVTACASYLQAAVIFSSCHKMFLYLFVLFRFKTILITLNPAYRSVKCKWAVFYLLVVIIIICTMGFLISVLIASRRIAEIDDGRCNFSPFFFSTFIAIYGAMDVSFSLISLLLLVFGLWQYRRFQFMDNENENSNSPQRHNKSSTSSSSSSSSSACVTAPQKMKVTLDRIIKFSLIAMVSTLMAIILVAMVDGASPIFLIGDMVVNSACVVWQFAPVNKDLTGRSYAQQWRVFCKETRIAFDCQSHTEENSNRNRNKSHDDDNQNVTVNGQAIIVLQLENTTTENENTM